MSYNEQLPKWDEPGTEPPESKKLAGWGISEKPPAGWFDWLFNRIYKVLSELQLKAAEKADVGDMATVPTASKNAAGAITELFQSVSDGKTVVAAAITDKGVPTAADDTFQVMADNIGDIVLGSGDALPGDVRQGKTFSNDSGPGKVGTVPVQAGGNVVPGPNDIVKPVGIYDTPVTVKGVVVPAANVLTGTTIAGTPGTMPNRNGAGDVTPSLTQAQGAYIILTPPRGYYDGATRVVANDPDFISANIRKNANVFGLVGTLVEGRQYAEAAVTSDSSGLVTLRGLAFQPYWIWMADSTAIPGLNSDVFFDYDMYPTASVQFQSSSWTTQPFSGTSQQIFPDGFTIKVAFSNYQYFCRILGPKV